MLPTTVILVLLAVNCAHAKREVVENEARSNETQTEVATDVKPATAGSGPEPPPSTGPRAKRQYYGGGYGYNNYPSYNYNGYNRGYNNGYSNSGSGAQPYNYNGLKVDYNTGAHVNGLLGSWYVSDGYDGIPYTDSAIPGWRVYFGSPD